MSCDGCLSGGSRRDFLRDGFALALGAFAAIGATGPAAAMTVDWIRASMRAGPLVHYPLPTADGASIDRDNQVILVRWEGEVYAFALACPHQNTALRWNEHETRFQCPKHKSKYQPDGTFISGRATRNMDRYSIRLEGGEVIVDTGALHKQDEDRAAWDAALVHVA